MSVIAQREVDVCPVAFPGKYQVWVIPGLWSLTGRQRPRWWFSSSCVCAVAPVHSSVELSVESIRLSGDYNAQHHVIYWLSNGSGGRREMASCGGETDLGAFTGESAGLIWGDHMHARIA